MKEEITVTVSVSIPVRRLDTLARAAERHGVDFAWTSGAVTLTGDPVSVEAMRRALR